MKSDIEIAQSIKLESIAQIGAKLGLKSDQLYYYGDHIAKIRTNTVTSDKKGKLVLVTAINPTPAGEGKTTVNIGLSMALNKLGQSALSVLREPSLGPVFGIKGGATGGGYSQILPMTDINLHFTGDLHAITTANNLIAAVIDNHIYHGNQLDIKRVTFKRCLDLNDRALRELTINGRNSRPESFNITAASEMMAIFCLARDLDDFKQRVDNTIVGYNSLNQPVYAKSLQVTGAVAAIIKQALLPNLVQTTEQTPAIIHGGPFANIAHGCNSIIATDLGQKLADYTIVEAGFGADLGAEKFFDIKANLFDLKPAAVVLVATIRSLKYQAGVALNELTSENLSALKQGLAHLDQHIANLKKYHLPIVVSINKFSSDTESEIELISKHLTDNQVEFALTDIWAQGSAGGLELAQKIIDLKDENNFQPLYQLDQAIKTKIELVAKQIYRANKVVYSDLALEQLAQIEQLTNNSPVCIAKTQVSFSDNPKLLNTPTNFDLHVQEIDYNSGANFVVVKTGKIMTMPGLAKQAAYFDVDVIDDQIVGIF